MDILFGKVSSNYKVANFLVVTQFQPLMQNLPTAFFRVENKFMKLFWSGYFMTTTHDINAISLLK